MCGVQPDGQHLASGAFDDTVRLWDTRSGELVGSPLTRHVDSVRSVAFSPDGRRVGSGSSDKTVRLWDARTREPFGAPLIGHTDVVASATFSPHSKLLASASWDLLASASWDYSVRLWPVVASREDSCATLTTNMSRKQLREWVSPDIEYMKICQDLPIPPDEPGET